MADGFGAAGFGGGFARGLASVLSSNRSEQRRKAEHDEDRQSRNALLAIQSLMPHVENPADLAPYFQQLDPTLFAPGKGKTPGMFDQIAPMLAPMLKQATGAATEQMTGPQPPGSSAPPTPVPPEGMLPGRPAVSPVTPPAAAPAQPMIGNVPIMTAAQKTDREVAQQTRLSEGMMERAKTVILPALRSVDPNATIQDAMRILGVNIPATPASLLTPFDQVPGEMPDGSPAFGTYDNRTGGFIHPDTKQPLIGFRPRPTGANATPFQSVKGRMPDGSPAFGTFDQGSGGFIHPDTKQPLLGFVPDDPSALQQFGVDREALARANFGKSYGALTQPQQQTVLEKEREMLLLEARSRTLGGGLGRFETPVDIPTAQGAGVTPGTRAADVAGQTVPTIANVDRRRSVTDLQTQLQEIKSMVSGAASPLPKQSELAGLAPGAAYALRRRSPRYRASIAALEARVNGIVNVVARSVAEQRGTQTEADAMRAEAGIVALRDAFLKGDTQESAAARIDQTLKILNQILSSLPASPTGQRQPGRAGGAGGGGAAGSGVPVAPTVQPAPPAGAGGGQGRIYYNTNGQIITP